MIQRSSPLHVQHLRSQRDNLLSPASTAAFFAMFSAWTTAAETQLAAVDQVQLLPADTVPPSALSVLGGTQHNAQRD